MLVNIITNVKYYGHKVIIIIMNAKMKETDIL